MEWNFIWTGEDLSGHVFPDFTVEYPASFISEYLFCLWSGNYQGGPQLSGRPTIFFTVFECTKSLPSFQRWHHWLLLSKTCALRGFMFCFFVFSKLGVDLPLALPPLPSLWTFINKSLDRFEAIPWPQNKENWIDWQRVKTRENNLV